MSDVLNAVRALGLHPRPDPDPLRRLASANYGDPVRLDAARDQSRRSRVALVGPAIEYVTDRRPSATDRIESTTDPIRSATDCIESAADCIESATDCIAPRGAGTQLTLACVDAPRAGSDLAPLDPKTAPLKGKSTSVGGNRISERCQAGNDRRNIAGIAIKPTTLPAPWGIAVTEPVKTEMVTQIHRIRLATDGIPFVAI